ncbi:MAG: SusD/RagB family nutrient-binding outer membrane lipoprotein [Bacteroidota bacterium]
MKNLKYIPIAFLLVFSSCKKSFNELNTDPKSPVNVPANTVFLAGQKNLVDAYTTSIWTSSPFRVLAQTWTQTANINEAKYQFTTNNAPGGWWDKLYTTVLGNLAQASTLYDAEKTLPAVKNNKKLITDILEVYTFNLLVTTYGNIPYTQALDKSIPFPKYDDAKTVTYDLISRLDKDIAGLDVSAASFGAADQIYKGNVAQWKKFAATLKLKLALLIADKDAATANTKVLEAVNSGVFTTAATDNAAFAYTSGIVVNSNPVWQDLVNGVYGVYYAPSAFFINKLIALNDPRLPLLFTKDINGNYSGAAAAAGGVNANLSRFNSIYLSPTSPGNLLDYAETEFLLAEAVERNINVGGTAEDHYKKAVRASIVYLGGTNTQADDYLAQPSVAYTTATGDWRQKIGYQKWIAFANRNWDSWTEIRRLGYPNINADSPPVGALSALPLRFYYPPAEQNNNNKNWQDAVAAIGGQDAVTVKLFWIR